MAKAAARLLLIKLFPSPGIELVTSKTFDFSAVDLIANLEMPAMKIASYEINDIPLIRYAAQMGVPVILSTGIAKLSDIARAIDACRKAKNEQVILLKCVSEYPTPYNEVNLRMLGDLQTFFKCLTGLSDHTMGYHIAIGAVMLGARMVEKHLTLKRADGGPDGSFSMEPAEFKEMVQRIRELEMALGDSQYHLTKAQEEERSGRRSLYVVRDVKKGELFTKENIRSIRPGAGVEPRYYDTVLGKPANRDISAGTPLQLSDFQ